VPDDPEELFAQLTSAMGAPRLSAEEVAAVLRLAKAVADASERKFAPLSCYAAGLVIGTTGLGGEDRVGRVRKIIEQVHNLEGAG
jgi:hypothetical protein